MRTRLVPAAAAIAAATLLVSGCGSSGSDSDGKRAGFASQSGRKILAAGFADTEKVKTMRIRGTVVEDGQRMKVDVRTTLRATAPAR